MCWKWSNIFISNHIDWIVAVTIVVSVVLKKNLTIMILDKVPPSVVRQQAFIEARDIDLSEVCPSSSYLIDVLQKKLKGWNANRKWWLISSLFFLHFVLFCLFVVQWLPVRSVGPSVGSQCSMLLIQHPPSDCPAFVFVCWYLWIFVFVCWYYLKISEI